MFPVMDAPGSRRRFVVIGAGGFGREVLDVIDAVDDAELVGVIDDGEPDLALLAMRGAVFLGGRSQLDELDADVCVVIAIGSGVVRAELSTAVEEAGMPVGELAHPLSSTGFGVAHDGGLIMCAGAQVTTNVQLGCHVDLHVNSSIGHDVRLGDFVSVYPGATVSGSVVVGSRATIGTGANVLPGVTIGADAFVGAGAVVIDDVAAGTVVVGVPARQLQR
jgi:sugar O-acyltransferase (sialic acid O-acetyltransferase NeuD family)